MALVNFCGAMRKYLARKDSLMFPAAMVVVTWGRATWFLVTAPRTGTS
jgi:hypothetical protein